MPEIDVQDNEWRIIPPSGKNCQVTLESGGEFQISGGTTRFLDKIIATIDDGALSSEEHGIEITYTGEASSGDSGVGFNIVVTATGSAASWFSGAYFKFVQASKAVNGYFCAAEFETASVAAGASDHAVIVLNATNTHTGSVPVSPYILLRDYGGTHADALFRIYGDSGQGGTTDATKLITTVSNAYEANCDYAVRCMYGSTPIWLLASSTAAS